MSNNEFEMDEPWAGFLPDGIPHGFSKEQIFIDEFTQCSLEVHPALTFQGDMTRNLYPHSHVEDIYIHHPLIGCNEMTNEWMLLAKTAMLKMLGLLKTIDKGKYTAGTNALNRRVFVYGDALSVSMHSMLHDKIL